MKNIPLLRKTLEYAEAHPEEIDLRSWARQTSCGTTACIAGTAAILAGHEIDWTNVDLFGVVFYITDGRYIEDVAREELGLDHDEVSLFYQKTMRDVWAVAEEITNGEISKPLAVRS